MTPTHRYITAGTTAPVCRLKPLVRAKIYHVCRNKGMIATEYKLLFIQSSFLILCGRDTWKPLTDEILIRKIKAMNDTDQKVYGEQNQNNHLLIEFIREINLPKKIEILALNSLSLETRRKKLESEIEDIENELTSSLKRIMSTE